MLLPTILEQMYIIIEEVLEALIRKEIEEEAEMVAKEEVEMEVEMAETSCFLSSRLVAKGFHQTTVIDYQ
ncbi:hypothetical protein ACOSP7_021220 [Xanthoceras sorbifolium]